MLHGGETWPVGEEGGMALQRADMRMVGWMCSVRLRDGVSGEELGERLGVVDIMSLLQQNRLRWYGRVLQRDGGDWVRRCMECGVVGSGPRGGPEGTWLEVCLLYTSDAADE